MRMQVNHLALIVAAAIQWVLGALWYGVVFKKSWMKLTGVTSGGSRGRAVFAMVCSFIASLVLVFVLAQIFMMAGTVGFMNGMALAIVCWLGFMAPPLFAQHIYENRPANLFAINAGYWVVAMALAGGVLAAWK